MFRSLLSCVVVIATFTTAISSVQAASKQLIITNRSGEAITTLSIAATATPDQPLVIAGAFPISNAATVVVTVTLPDGQCMFDAAYSFSSGQNTKQPDLDICQLDGLIVE